MASTQVTTSKVESLDDFQKNPPGIQQRWESEIELAEKERGDWVKRAKKICKRYRDERTKEEEGDHKFNVLWSTIQTELPAIYQRPPKPEVGRRFKTKNPVTRTAAAIVERYLAVDLERDKIDSVMDAVVLDRLLSGLGQVWVEYAPVSRGIPTPVVVRQAPDGSHIHAMDGSPYQGPAPQPDPNTGTLMGSKDYPRIVDVRAPITFLLWSDFIHSPARQWTEVRWAGRKRYLTRDECTKMFATGMQMFKWAPEQIPLNDKAVMTDELEKKSGDLFKRAVIYELWNDSDARIYFVCVGMPVPLEVRPQPVKLEARFPCPEPYLATTTNDTLVPVPDFCEWQDLADEVDELSQRIAMLTKGCKLVGVRNAAIDGISRVLEEGFENDLIPVDAWAAFAEKGGIKGNIDFLPLEEVAGVISTLNEQRANRLDLLSQVSGIGELMRGQGDPSATATHDRITANFGSLRLREKQDDLARFVESAMQIKAEIICQKAPPDVLMMVSSIDETPDGQDQKLVTQAIQLLKDERLRDFKVEVEEASMVALDDDAEKSARLEFLQTIGPYIQGMVQMPPPLQAISSEMLSFAVRGFRVGRELEGTIETWCAQIQQQAAAQAAQAAQQPPPPPLPLLVENAKATNATNLEMQRHQDRMQEIAAEGAKDGSAAAQEAAAKVQQQNVKTAGDLANTAAEGHQDRATKAFEATLPAKPLPGYAPTMAMPLPRTQRH